MQKYAPQRSFVQRNEDVVRRWFHYDASKEVLGHMAVEIAMILMGKNKPSYTPHVDCGDYVIVTNASKIQVSGEKTKKKVYHYYTGYIGGLRSHSLGWMLERKPEKVIRLAVRRMLPKNKLGRKMLSKLKVFAGPEHNMSAQEQYFEKVRTRRSEKG